MTRRLRVVVAEDSFLVREGLVQSLEEQNRVEVLSAEEDLDSLRAAVEATRPDVVLTDIRMPPTRTDEGISFATELRRTHPETGVVVLSEHATRTYALDLFEGGAARRAYLLKDRIADGEYLVGAIEAVADGRPVLDSRIVELVVAQPDDPPASLGGLTERELEVLQLVAEGKSNSAIAGEFVITRRAVERHINSIFSKLRLEESRAVNRRVLAALLYARARD